MNQYTTCKHGKTYTCKRIRMLNYLRNKGFIPYETIAELENPKYLNWKFHNSPELEKVVYEYFDSISNRHV